MIWATVSSQSCFCWLWSFSIFGCKEYNQSDFGVDHLVMSMCRVFSCVVGRGCLLWPVRSLGKTLLAFALLHSVFQGQLPLHFHFSLSCIGEGNGNPLQCSCLENPRDGVAWWASVYGVAQSRTWLSDFTFIFHCHASEKEMAIHSSILAWRIPGTGEPGGLPSMGSHRVGHDWSDLAAAAMLPFISLSMLFIHFPYCPLNPTRAWKSFPFCSVSRTY